MRIDSVEFGFEQVFDHAVIEKITCKYDDVCTVYFHDKSVRTLQIECSVYNRQYGIQLSNDGSKLFVGSWEKGLSAYAVDSGKLLWRYKYGKIRNIFVYSGFLIALRANTEIIKVDIETGKPLGHIKSGSLESIFYLDDTHIFADKVVGRCCVIDVKEMCIQKKYSPKAINPAACLSCVITSAVFKNNTVTISGMEQYPKKALADLAATATIPFVRVIEHNFTEISAEGGQG